MVMKSLIPLFLSCMCCHAVPLRDVAYVPGGDPLQTLDIHRPAKDPTQAAPVLIGIHGGGWAFGDKSHAGFVQPKSEWFLKQGFLFVSINYRLSPKVVHPTHVEDVCKALAWIGENIDNYGGDPKQLYLLGHSAGAHLAALAALDELRQTTAGVHAKSIRGVILLDGAAYHVPNQVATTWRLDKLYTRAFTQDLATQEDASPTLKVVAMKGTPPPFLILHVAHRKDSADQSQGLAHALRAKGGEVQVVAIDGKTHATINRDLGKAGDVTTQAVEKFLRALK